MDGLNERFEVRFITAVLKVVCLHPGKFWRVKRVEEVMDPVDM